MAIQTLNTIKNWFKTTLKPSQQQFWDTWDSFRHKLDKVPVKEVEGIDELLNAKADKSVLNEHITDINAHASLFELKEDKSQKGIAGGYAPLNSFTKLASQYLDIVNDLVSGGVSSLLSAEQGVVLQNQIKNINATLASDNINLNTFQEVVDTIESIQTSLSTILVNDLTTGGGMKALTAEMGKILQSNKVDKVAGKSLLLDSEIDRLITLANYTHPDNHSPDIILQDANNRFVTDNEKEIWNEKQSALGFHPENIINKNVANGYAGLGADGKLISSQIPSITINDTFVVDSQVEMLSLNVETGDIAVRSDLSKCFILKGSNPELLEDWQELLTPTSDVTTVFGRNGSVTAQTGDYTADQINETPTRRFQSTNQQLFNDATSSIQTQLDSKISNVTHTGDAIGATALTVKGINGTLLSQLPTGLLKNTTSTGVPVIAKARIDYAEPTASLPTGILKNTASTGEHSIATAGDFPILNQNTTGTANNATNLAGQPSTYYAPISSPAFLGTPTATTAPPETSNNQLATTAFVSNSNFGNVKTTGMQTISGHKYFTDFLIADYGTLFLKSPTSSAYQMVTALENGIRFSPNSQADFLTEATSNGIKFGTKSIQAQLNTNNLTSSKIFLMPDQAGTIALKGDFLATPPSNTTSPSFIIPNSNLTTTPVNGAIERDAKGILWETHNGVREKLSVTDVPYKSITNLNTLFTSYRRSSVNTCQVNYQSEFAPDALPSWGILTSCKTDDEGEFGVQTYVSMGSIPNTYVRNCNNGTWSAWVKLN
ncbi:pyocin knob domain-containing protein [Flavobacterium sp.]|uniref:pyocin knob domain-containing protein n=1 Tax=Flavobacterium sp. TaxID=239 RepID=UPI0031D6CA98